MNLLEINEGYAVEVLALATEWELDPLDRLNVNGSDIALGHPVGATGLRIMTTMLHELGRTGGRYEPEAVAPATSPDRGPVRIAEATNHRSPTRRPFPRLSNPQTGPTPSGVVLMFPYPRGARPDLD